MPRGDSPSPGDSMHQSQPQDGSQQVLRSMNGVLFIARSLAASVELFLHDPRTIGERYMGLQAGAALLIMVFWPAFWSGHDAGPMLGLLLAFLVLCAVARAGAVMRARRGGVREHSFYTGRPWLMPRRGRIGETSIKGALEPALVFIAGKLAMSANAPLGGYLMLAAFGLFVSVQTTLIAERRRVLDLHDASIDQRRIMEQWQRGRRE